MCGGKRDATQRERKAAQAAWQVEHAADDLRPEVFQQSIFPLLQSMPLSALTKAGLGVISNGHLLRVLLRPCRSVLAHHLLPGGPVA